jgi:hypothetical protein
MANDMNSPSATDASAGSVQLRRIGADERRLREFLRQVEEVGQAAPEGVEIDMPLALYEVATLFSRTRSQVIAIRLLIENGLLEEALSLSRGLFTDSLRLEYLGAESPEVRESVFLNRQREAYRSFRVKFGEGRRALGLEGLTAEELERVHAELRKVRERARRLGADINMGYPSDHDLAIRFGRQEDLWVQQLSHEAVHGSQLMLRWRTSRRGDSLAIETRSYDVDRMCAIGIYCMKPALRSHVLAAGMLPWDWDPDPARAVLGNVIGWENELEDREKVKGG